MYSPCHQLLPRAGFAKQEDARLRGRDLLDQVEHPPHRRAVADDLLEIVGASDFLSKVDVLGLELILQALDLGKRSLELVVESRIRDGIVRLTLRAAQCRMHTRRSRYLRHRFPPDIISHAVWLYYKYCLSFRDVEDLLAERGVLVSYETIRQ